MYGVLMKPTGRQKREPMAVAALAMVKLLGDQAKEGTSKN